MISATIAAAGGGSAINFVKDFGGGIVDKVGSLFSGSRNRATPEKREQREQITQYLREYTTADERREFILSTGSSLDRIKPTPAGMAYFYTGEDDFYHKGVGANHQQFLDRLPSWLQGMVDRKSKSDNAYPAAAAASTGGAGAMNPALLIGGAVLLAAAFFGLRG